MKYIKNISDLILERRIAQVSSSIQVTFGFDLVRSSHAQDRQDPSKRNIEGHNNSFISNMEMKEFVYQFRDEIARGIVNGEIVSNGDTFVIRSVSHELAITLAAEQVSGTYWKLVIVTVFRESENNFFRVGKEQVVYTKN